MYVVAKSDVGMTRKENQDRVFVNQIGEAVIAVVCDGMGGVQSGGIASEVAANAVFDRLSINYRDGADSNSIRNMLLTSLTAANTIVYQKSLQDDDKSGMGTTCVGAVVNNGKAYIANIGDSRAYLITTDKITQITNDHTFVEMLYEKGEIEKEEINTHEMSHIITKAIGVEKDVKPDYFEIDLEENSIILICTDGLTNYCDDEKIFQIVNGKSVDIAINDLINYANDEGGKDNITIALIKN